MSKTNNNNDNNSNGRILDVDTEWTNRSEAEADTSRYNDDDVDEAFHFLLHKLFPEQRIDLTNILSKTNKTNNNSYSRSLDVNTEWRDRSDANAGTSAYNDDDDDETFHFLLHKLFLEHKTNNNILTSLKCALKWVRS